MPRPVFSTNVWSVYLNYSSGSSTCWKVCCLLLQFKKPEPQVWKPNTEVGLHLSRNRDGARVWLNQTFHLNKYFYYNNIYLKRLIVITIHQCLQNQIIHHEWNDDTLTNCCWKGKKRQVPHFYFKPSRKIVSPHLPSDNFKCTILIHLLIGFKEVHTNI